MTYSMLVGEYVELIINLAHTEGDDEVVFGDYILAIDDTILQLVRGLDFEWYTDSTGTQSLRVPVDQAKFMLDRLAMMNL